MDWCLLYWSAFMDVSSLEGTAVHRPIASCCSQDTVWVHSGCTALLNSVMILLCGILVVFLFDVQHFGECDL